MCDISPEILGAYHDGELSPSQRAEFEAHLAGCTACMAELAQLREVSSLFTNMGSDPMHADELTRLHEAVDDAMDRPVLRMFGMISAIAASLLIVSSVWLMEISRRQETVTSPTPTIVKSPEAWERLATTLKPEAVEPAPGSTESMADASLAEWMLHGVSVKEN